MTEMPNASAYDHETKQAIFRRLVPLTEGRIGQAMDRPSTYDVSTLMSGTMCVELGHFREEDTRNIFATILMKLIYDARLSHRVEGKHMLVVEEARHIAPPKIKGVKSSVGERMISEMRKFDESMMFIAQFPSQVAPDIIQNSGVRIIHRMNSADDLKATRDSLSMSQEQVNYVTSLQPGEAVVSLLRLQQPILVQVTR